MKRPRAILILIVAIGGGLVLSHFLIPSLIKRIFISSKKETLYTNADIENAILRFKQQKQTFFGPQIAFEIPRKPNKSWNWFLNWKSAGIESSQMQNDRILSISKVGNDRLVYSIPIRWREDKSAGPAVSEIETNISLEFSGFESYSISDEEYKRLTNYLTLKTPGADLRCTIKRDASGKIVQDTEYFEGVLSVPQNQWGLFVSEFFKEVYGHTNSIILEELKPGYLSLF